MRLFWKFGKIINLWVRTTVAPKDPKTHLELNHSVPIIYALPRKSISDILILDRECKKADLARPRRYWRFTDVKNPEASYLYLSKLGLLVTRTQREEPPVPLVELLRRLSEDPQSDVQIVPVSIVWGRDPGRNDRYSWLRLLFTDDENAGMLQKLLVVLVQGQNVAVHFGKSLWLRDLLDPSSSSVDMAKKLRRILRVHFRTQRNIMLGPKLYDRSRIIENLVATRVMQGAIRSETISSKTTPQKVEFKARSYLREISSAQSHAAIRFFDIILTYLWTKKFNGQIIKNSERLRERVDHSEVVYATSHRSHFDYLLIGYVLYYLGMTVPHTAAGVNLNFWPVGPLLRRGGAFFLRRSFKGNRLYTTAFTEYVHYLLSSGYSMSFYPEGGRSRTGRLLQPKTGMLSMVVHSFMRSSQQTPYKIVPVFVCYDRVPEIKSYLKELRGAAKTNESMFGLVKAFRVLRSPFGKSYINFSEPIDLASYLDSVQPDWREFDVSSELKPRWLNACVAKLAFEMMVRINSAVIPTPVALVATVLLANPQRAMVEEELLGALDVLLRFFRICPYSSDMFLPDYTPQQIVKECQAVAPLSRASHPTGDVLYLAELDGVVMSYYRNNIVHIFALPSFLACFFHYNEKMTLQDIVDAVKMSYVFMRSELFLRYSENDIPRIVREQLDAMVQCGMLKRSSDSPDLFLRAEITGREFFVLRLLGRSLGHVYERFSIASFILAFLYSHRASIPKADFEKRCQQVAQRMAALGGINDTEFYDRNLYQDFISVLQKNAYIEITEFQQLVPLPAVMDLSAQLEKLISSDVRQSLGRLISESDLVP